MADLSANETGNLIAADKVEGTSVYNTNGDHLGSIHNVMINKRNGRVAYAVMSFGGFLGIGEEYHPLPWEVLRYDVDKGGYIVNLDRGKLEGAPHYGANDRIDWNDAAWGRRVNDYYGVPPYAAE